MRKVKEGLITALIFIIPAGFSCYATVEGKPAPVKIRVIKLGLSLYTITIDGKFKVELIGKVEIVDEQEKMHN